MPRSLLWVVGLGVVAAHAEAGRDFLQAYRRLPLSFEQAADRSSMFVARGGGGLLVVGACGVTGPWGMKMKLVGVNPGAGAQHALPLPGKAHYLIGRDPARWRTNVPTYARVEYKDVYPGVDVAYYGDSKQLEYDFIVAAGADWRAIRLVFEGVRGMSLNASGDIVLSTAKGQVHHRRPRIYQGTNASRREIRGRFVVNGPLEVGFELDGYDPALPLIIDPVLSYSTTLGGAGDDRGYGVATSADGCAYITGETGSPNFPAAYGSRSGASDVFVLKLNASGTAILYATYLGGGGRDSGRGIAVDESGNAFVTGFTYSSNFPVTAGAAQSAAKGQEEAFIIKLNSTGTGLLYGTYAGGTGSDFANAIAVNTAGEACVTGHTSSLDFRVTQYAAQTAFRGGFYDAFALRLNATGTSLLFATLLGGGGTDAGNAIAVDPAGYCYVAGQTDSLNFPLRSALRYSNASMDAFAAKLDGSGQIVYSTYLGGRGVDMALAVTVDQRGQAHVAGSTSSTDFPATSGASQGRLAGGYDGFIAKLSSGGDALVYATYLGGSLSEEVRGIAVDKSGYAYLTGWTTSFDFPVRNALASANSGNGDAFVASLDPVGQTLFYSTYLGGGGNDAGQGIAVAGNGGGAFVVGYTMSQSFPAVGGPVAQAGGNGDVFVAKVSLSQATLWSYQNGIWTGWQGGGRTVLAWGGFSDTPVVSDWGHSGRRKIGVYSSGYWYVDWNGNNQWDGGDRTFWFGMAGDIPVAGDWDGSGVQKIGVYRNGYWYIDWNGNNQWDGEDRILWFGAAGDIPIVGDWDSSGRLHIGIYRNGYWYVDWNGNNQWDTGDRILWFGAAGDIPVVGDWDGSGHSHIGIYRNGSWYVDWNGNSQWDAGDVILTYDGQCGVPVVQ